MPYRLVVSEKPSVAMAYAKVLGVTNRKDGYLEGGGYLVSWCIGHLVELAPPNIQKLRKAHGLTQEEAAIKLNISDRHMRSLEKGTYAPLDLFVEIAVHFDVTLDYLILGKVETKTELALSKKINDQKQAMKSLREQLLAFAMEIEVE